MKLLILSLVFCVFVRDAVSSPQHARRHGNSGHGLMRRHDNSDHTAGAQSRQTPVEATSPEQMLVAGIASSGSITGEKTSDEAQNQALIAASLEQYKRHFAQAQKLLRKAGKNDVFVNGIEVEQVPMSQVLKEYREERDQRKEEYADYEKREQEASRKYNELLQKGDRGALMQQAKEAARVTETKSTAYNAMDAPRSGFWAKDRPDEERLDPNNMKIYTWRTYRQRFPFRHSWETESQWKKLPLAPKKIRKIHKSTASNGGGSQLLEQGSGAMLVDEENRELVYTRNNAGHYFQGRELPSEEEQLRLTRPRHWQRLQNEKVSKARYLPLYPDLTEDLAFYEQQLNDSHVFNRESAFLAVANMIAEMEDTMKLKPKTWGKAFVSVFGADGNVANFNADVGIVTGKIIKQRVENATGIPWKAQRILYQGVELDDKALLNTVTGASRTVRLSLHTNNDNVLLEAPRLKSKLPEVRPENKIMDSSDVLLEKSKAARETPKQISAMRSEKKEISKGKRHEKSKHHHHKHEHRKLEKIENVARKLATSELVDTSFTDDDALKSNDDADSDDGQAADDESNWDFWGAMGKMGVGSSEPSKEDEDASYQATAQAVINKMEKDKSAKKEKRAPEATTTEPPQHAKLISRTIYTKDPSGKWVLEKSQPGTGKPDDFLDAPDYGIPVEERMQQTSEVADSENKISSSTIASDALIQQSLPPRPRVTVAEERKRIKHAMSEEMKWKLKMRAEEAKEKNRLVQAQHGQQKALTAKSAAVTSAPVVDKVTSSLAPIAAHSSKTTIKL